MEGLCGDALWNESFTLNTDNPFFTPCFETTILAWVPAAFLLIGIPFEISTYQRSIDRHLPLSVFSVTKLLMSLALTGCTVAELLLLEKNVSSAQYVGPAVEMIAYIVTAIMTVGAMRNGVITSGPQFVFWLVDSICRAVTFCIVANTYIEADQLPKEGPARDKFILALAHLVGSFLLLILNSFADKTTNVEYMKSRKPCPEYSASFFNRLVFSWGTSLMWTGWRKPLTPDDLWDINPKLASTSLVPKFERLLNEQKSERQDGDEGDTKPLISILPLLWRSFGGSFAMGSVLQLCYDLLNVTQPILMKLIMSFVESWNAPPSSETTKEEQWKGFLYAGLLFCVLTLQSILSSQYVQHMSVIGVKVRTTLISALYKKSLKLSAAAKKESSMGEVVNLMSVDVQRFMDLLPYINALWSSILQIGLYTFFIYRELGWPALVGVAILVLSIPLNIVLMRLMQKLNLKQMKFKDSRIRLMNEILGGMKVLKLYAWEPSFIGQVLGIRNNEVKVMKTAAYYGAFFLFFFTIAPFLVGLGAFASYIFKDEGQVLTAQQAFVTLSYLYKMRMALVLLPGMVVQVVQAKVSVDRVNKYLNNEELSEDAVENKTEEGEAISITDGHFKWGLEDPTVLKDINLRVKEGSLTAVVGSVGAGKSSLISAMLGELHKESGRIAVNGKIAYVPQQAWIQNTTLKENIIFNLEADEEKYKGAVESCALTTDLAILPAGDQTEIGEKGINLSGGQKQRVGMARAVYSDASLFFLDDPLSAVDSHVGKHIFEKVIGPKGVLGGKTRVLVTHGVTYLPDTDHIIVLKEGRISEQGSYQDLVEQKGAFSAFLAEYMDGDAEEKDDMKDQSDSKEEEDPQKGASEEKETRDEEKIPVKGGSTLIEKEHAETGSVDFDVYLYYMRAVGIAGCIAIIFGQGLNSALQIMGDQWIIFWTSNTFGNASETKYRNMYLGVYGGVGFFRAVIVMSYSAVIAFSTLNASRRLHKNMLTRVMMSPMSFFDKTPVGRIVNRFGKDVDVCDNNLRENLRMWFSNFAQFIVIVIQIMTVIYMFIVVILPVGLLFFILQRFYVSTSRQLKRLESISRSPIYSHFGESLQGSSTIRAFGLEKEFINQSQTLVDKNQVLNMLVRVTADVETNIVAVERLKEYSMIEQEAPWISPDNTPEKTWPQVGMVEFEDYGLRYRKDTPLVVENISVKVEGGQKVGIVGRTGAGKSTLTVALFRLVESALGKIKIDGKDISKIGLHDLRKKLTIIPQDPVLFSGTLRMNLDPFNNFSDSDLWATLEKAHLGTFVSGTEEGLEHPISEGGENLSVGQRQLVCLARALLRKTRVLILDEATAAVDLETDDLIQATIRKEFVDSTVMTIAHRLNTIMDYDRIMVLDKGHVVEFASPHELFGNTKSIFYGMAVDAGLTGDHK